MWQPFDLQVSIFTHSAWHDLIHDFGLSAPVVCRTSRHSPLSLSALMAWRGHQLSEYKRCFAKKTMSTTTSLWLQCAYRRHGSSWYVIVSFWAQNSLHLLINQRLNFRPASKSDVILTFIQIPSVSFWSHNYKEQIQRRTLLNEALLHLPEIALDAWSKL